MRISPSAKQISHRVHDEVLKPASFFPYLPFDVLLRATEIAAVGLLPKPRRPIWDSSIWKILYTRAVSQQKACGERPDCRIAAVLRQEKCLRCE